MGLACHINLHQPVNRVYVPGEVVSGVIRYTVDEPTNFSRITISLKGRGRVRIRSRINRNSQRQPQTYTNSEVYVDDDHIYEHGKMVEVGSQDMEFSFVIPTNLPPTFDYYDNVHGYLVRCRIKYYVRIKFERPEMFSFAKHFRKDIIIVPGITPSLSMEPAVYEKQRKLIQLFRKKDSIVDVKVTIMNSVIPTGGKINVTYEIVNNTNVKIRSVKTHLIEVNKFRTFGQNVKDRVIVSGTEFVTLSIPEGETGVAPIEINLPISLGSIENSELISKYYYVKVTVVLPLPYRNISVDVPVQIGDIVQPRYWGDDPPPSYWEAMGEAKKDDANDDDDDD